jgi:SAM-dependent methyltransferase
VGRRGQALPAEHGDFLGDADLLWCPEGLREADARLLGDVRDRDVLEVGCGAAQGARWLVAEGARVTAFDVSYGQLPSRAGWTRDRRARRAASCRPTPSGCRSADRSFDVVMSAFGGIPFVADSAGTMREVLPVLRPAGGSSSRSPTRCGGCSRTTRAGRADGAAVLLRPDAVRRGRRDRRGGVRRAPPHRPATGCGARRRGLVLDDLVEPEWPEGHDREWGQWSPLRGRLLPGTSIWVAHRPA